MNVGKSYKNGIEHSMYMLIHPVVACWRCLSSVPKGRMAVPVVSEVLDKRAVGMDEILVFRQEEIHDSAI